MRLTKRGEKPKPTEKLAKAGHGVAKNQKLKSKANSLTSLGILSVKASGNQHK